MWRTIRRVIRSGFINFWRNGAVSIASFLVMTVTLSVVTGILLSQAVLENSLTQIESKVDITVYFTTVAQENDILDLKGRIEKLPEVKEVSYVSRDQALEDFKTKHSGDYLTLQALDEIGENPLGALLNIRAKTPAEYEGVAKFLENTSALSSGGASIVDKINYNQNKVVIDRLTNIIAGARQLGLIITLVLVIISILILFNTISLTIFFAREEISVMRLVGAENKYIRGPFMIEGIIYGVLSAIFTGLAFIPITMWLGTRMTAFLGLDLWAYYRANCLQLFVITLIAGALLGVIASFLATKRYLR